MILGVNIGNTNIRAAIGYPDKIIAQTVVYIEEGMEQIEINLGSDIWGKIEGSIIATVVPPQTEAVIKILEEKSRKPIQRIDIKHCGNLKTDRYQGLLGEDRVVCCARALQKFSPPFVVIDYGTATTINVVNEHGEFLGGAILAGLETGLKALTSSTAQLPRIRTRNLGKIPLIGTNTVESLQSGAIIGLASATEGVLRRMEEELSCKLPAIVTGGHAPSVLPYCLFSYTYESSLLLEGLLALYKK